MYTRTSIVTWMVFATCQSVAWCQNPLRAAPQEPQRVSPEVVRQASLHQSPRTNFPTDGDFGRFQAKSTARSAGPGTDALRMDHIEPPRHDVDVQAAAFEEIPATRGSNANQNQSGMRLLGSSLDADWQDPNRILDLIMKVSLNLVFVLSFAVGIILIAKRWVKPKSTTHSVERARSDSLAILQTLQIDQRISIRLVQWRSNRFLVACDQNGIKSVNPLNATFDQTLKELDDDNDNATLVKRLLANMELQRT